MSIKNIKAYQDSKDPWTFVASSEAVDRYGDIIAADGWDLRAFKKNPIALWQHNASQPIGNWQDVRVEDDRLIARLVMVKPGISSIADMLRGMVEERVIRAVSVGFRPTGKAEPILDSKGQPTGGLRFTKQELMEISLVSVPANPEALSLARSMGMNPEQLRAVFTENGDVSDNAGRATGPSARSSIHTSNGKTHKMPTLAERIAQRDAEIAVLRDQITELSAIETPDDNDTAALEQRTAELNNAVEGVARLRSAQAALAASVVPAGEDNRDVSGSQQEQGSDRQRNAETQTRAPAGGSILKRGMVPAHMRGPRGEKDPVMTMVRAALVLARSRVEMRTPDDIIRSHYSGSKEIEAVLRAAVDPARTNVTGWAAELVNTVNTAFLDVLRPESIFFNLPMGRFAFGRGKLRIPSRASGTVNGDFVAEGAPIRVGRVTFGSQILEPYKLGVIVPMTREIAQLSDPAFEPIIREMMIGDTRDTIDARFLDNSAAVATLRPAGLQSLAGANTAVSTGTTLANIITDLKAAIAAHAVTNTGRTPVWIMNTQRYLSLSLVTNAAGNFMFKDELAQGTLLGVPVLASNTVPAAVVFLVDAFELAAAYEDLPQMDLSDQATLHMESVPATVPPTAGTVDPIAYGPGGAPGGTPGTPAIGDFAQPISSMFQTASMALRLLWDMSWHQRRAGAVYTITAVAW